MAEQKDKRNPRVPSKRHFKPVVKQVLTAEEQAAVLAERAKKLADAKAEAERIHNYGKNVENMSHRQLTAELNRITRAEHVKVGKDVYEPQAGLNILLSTVLGAVLKNTRTSPRTDDGRKLRLDQINLSSLKTMNPGW